MGCTLCSFEKLVRYFNYNKIVRNIRYNLLAFITFGFLFSMTGWSTHGADVEQKWSTGPDGWLKTCVIRIPVWPEGGVRARRTLEARHLPSFFRSINIVRELVSMLRIQS